MHYYEHHKEDEGTELSENCMMISESSKRHIILCPGDIKSRVAVDRALWRTLKQYLLYSLEN